jgi:hypothetical protein
MNTKSEHVREAWIFTKIIFRVNKSRRLTGDGALNIQYRRYVRLLIGYGSAFTLEADPDPAFSKKVISRSGFFGSD